MSEYWIEGDGSVQYADGDVGEYNHEGVVIDRVRGEIIDAVNNVCKPTDRSGRGYFDYDGVDWDEWKQAVATAYAQVLIQKTPAKQQQYEALLDDDPDKLLMAALKAAGVKKADWGCAEGEGDARDYAMQKWRWKTYRNGHVDTWLLTRQDMKAIIDGLDDISNQDGWSEKKFNRYKFSINVFSNKRYFSLTVPQMQAWLERPQASVVQDSPEPDQMNAATAANVRNYELSRLPPYYQNKPFPFGDSTQHRGRNFWEWLSESAEPATDEPAFLAAIRKNPKDRLPWLVFADWLDERNDPRGSLIRVIIDSKGKRQSAAFASIEEAWEQVMPTELGSLLQRASKVAETSALLSSSRRRTVGLAATAQILKLAKNYDDATELEAAMGKINQLMGGYGVEHIRGERALGGYWGDSVAIYVNVGESYDNTVLFNLVTYRVQITSMGDFVERYGQRYGIE